MSTEPNTQPAAEPTTEPPTDVLSRRSHTLNTASGPISYTSESGTVVLRTDELKDGVWHGRKAVAEIAVTAYTMDDADVRERPVTFAFNGGPGSSSLWLHMGLLGPRRVDMGDAGDLVPPPYDVIDNPETLLSVSDLVFIDPVSTGLSRVVSGGKPKDFHGFTADIESVGEVIRSWVTRENRWLSPKFVAGESYGTTRAAALAQYLQERSGLYLNGLMLISSVLDFGTANFENGNDRAHALYLPFYAATAHFHGKHGDRPLRDVLDEAEAYAARDYPWVLSRGNRLTETERSEAVSRVAALTGLSEDYVDRADLRIEHWRFFGELLRDQGRTVGRLDSRFTGLARSRIAEEMDADPSMDAITGPYSAAFQHYLGTELGVTSEQVFRTISEDVGREWSFKEFENSPVYVIDRLARAMRQNSHLAVQFAYGYYDGATPYFCAMDDVARLAPQLLPRLEHHFYESGHMTYVHQPTRLQQSADLADFVRRHSGRGGGDARQH
ncbi:S10 family peptidase [Flexivirga oryzae]|uniref:Carboxypeptidase C (Cathepsin A) n=1 Tax=Flexivirga oryzae TaxID=1794944 RepID=A0A839N497_9MICO|nr:carboxypeptidase C (cathepsin A) [Flexivirga oryzae]